MQPTHPISCFQATDDIAIISTNPDGQIKVFNSGAEQLTGYSRQDIIDKRSILDLFPDGELARLQHYCQDKTVDHANALAVFQQLAEDGDNQAHPCNIKNLQGESHHTIMSISPLAHNSDHHSGLLFMLRDPARLYHILLSDLPGETVFVKVLNREFRRLARLGHHLSAIKIKVDDFEQYSDEFGHQRAQETLAYIASLLFSRIQRAGDMLSYHGHNEFCVIMPHTDQPGAVKLAEYCRLLIQEAGLPTLSIGLCNLKPSAHEDIDSMIKRLDFALLEAQKQGKNCTRIG